MEAFHGLFFISGEFREKYVVVYRGVIKEVKSELSGMNVTRIKGHVLPGGVDMHVHFRDPGETEKPAQICEINKGFIAEGYDADFISVDLKNMSEIKGEELHSECGWTPFEKFGGIFPDYVYLRGEMILQEGDVHIHTAREDVALDSCDIHSG